MTTSTRRIERLEENLAATTLDLPAADLAELTQASDSASVVGERYSAQMQSLVDRT